jgi:hypothetical protein
MGGQQQAPKDLQKSGKASVTAIDTSTVLGYLTLSFKPVPGT